MRLWIGTSTFNVVGVTISGLVKTPLGISVNEFYMFKSSTLYNIKTKKVTTELMLFIIHHEKELETVMQ